MAVAVAVVGALLPASGSTWRGGKRLILKFVGVVLVVVVAVSPGVHLDTYRCV